MIEKLDKYLIGIAAGVRFNPNFSIEDQMGRILDNVLYPKNSYFNPKVFPEVSTPAPGQKVLHNKRTGDRLVFDSSNFVLEAQFGDNFTFQYSDCDEILSKFDEQIIKGTMSKFNVRDIIRIGLIKRYLFPIRDLAQSFVERTIGNTLEGVNDINLRFSKKMPVPEAMVKRDVNDWSNAIFNIIKKADLDEIFMSIDYQIYFEPPLNKASDIRFQVFSNATLEFIEDHYLPWLNNNYMEIENEAG